MLDFIGTVVITAAMVFAITAFVSVLAVPAVVLAARASAAGDRFIAAWNALGIADLLVAITLGVTSGNGSPLQIFEVGAGSGAMQMLPWSFVPTVLVPFYLIVH